MPVSDFTPATTDVGALMRARTKDDMGNELGNFTDATRPTGTEVAALITEAVGVIAAQTGADICDKADLRASAKNMATLYTAMLIELSYYPEQVPGDRSPFNNYKALYDDGIPKLVESISELCTPEESPDSPAGDADLPLYNFGDEMIIGRKTIL